MNFCQEIKVFWLWRVQCFVIGRCVKMFDTNADPFKEFLQFFYLQKVTLTSKQIEEVMLLTHKYKMPDCVDTCITFLMDQIDTDNLFRIYKLATTLKNLK